MANGMRIPTVVLAFSLKGKNNYICNVKQYSYVVLAFSLKGKNNRTKGVPQRQQVVLAFSLKGKNNEFVDGEKIKALY